MVYGLINIIHLQNWYIYFDKLWFHMESFQRNQVRFKVFDIQLLFQELHQKSAICHIGCHMVPYGNRYGKWQIGEINDNLVQQGFWHPIT